MSITNEKLQTIKDNVSKVYHSGQMDVIQNAASLKGFESSKAVLIDDVSPVTHEMGVKVRGKNLFDKNNVNKLNAYINGRTITSGGQMSTVWVPCSPLTTYTVSKIESSRFCVCFTSEVPKMGITVNNKITNNASTQITNTSSDTDKYIVVWLYHANYDTDITLSEILDSLQIELGTSATEYTPYIPDLTAVKVKKQGKNLIPYPYINSSQTIHGVTFTVNSDGTITANGTAEVDGTGINAYLEITSISTFYIPKGDYILSGCPLGGSSKTYSLTAVNGSGISYTKLRQDIGNGITLSSSGEYWIIRCQVMAGQTVENIVFKPQLELGSTATDYEPYISPIEYIPNADGTVEGVTSLYPNTTLTTDTDGVIIDCDYYKDIDKAYNELSSSMALSGGE